MEHTQGGKEQTMKSEALGILAALVGAAVGKYSGIHLLIPLVATAIVWWVGKKSLSETKQLFLPAFSVQAGHLSWFAFGLIYIGQIDSNVLDVLVLVVGLAWLILKPGLGPVLLLGAYQAFVLPVNTILFLDADVGTVAHKALLVHIIWRVMALFLMGQAYFTDRCIIR